MDGSNESASENVETLLVVGIKAFDKPLLPLVVDDTSETLCGWHLASPRPQYKLEGRGGKQKKQIMNRNYSSNLGVTAALQSVTNLPALKGKRMTGKLTEDFDYIYEGRSVLQDGITPLKKPQPPKQHETPHHIIPQLILNPVIVDRSDTMNRKARNNIHRLAQIQMKSDIFYEQMIIDEKLRRIGFNSPIRESIPQVRNCPQVATKSDHISIPPPQLMMDAAIPTSMNIISPTIGRASKSDTNIHRNTQQRKSHRKLKKPRSFDWTVMGQPPTKSSFSRILQSSSVILKNNE